MIKKLMLKLGNMRKAQDFIVYPYKADQTQIKIQSDKRIAVIDINSRKGKLSRNGPYSYHLAVNPIDIELTEEQINYLGDKPRGLSFQISYQRIRFDQNITF